jgi:transposase-like protein
MPWQVCSICQHPNRPAIDDALAQRLTTKHSFSRLAERFSVNRSALFRHANEHRHLKTPTSVVPGQVMEPSQNGTTDTQESLRLDTDALKRAMTLRWKGKEEMILTALTFEKINEMKGRDLSVAAGIAADKVMKLTGLDRQEPEGLVLHVPAQLLAKFMLAVQIQDRPGPAPTVVLTNQEA